MLLATHLSNKKVISDSKTNNIKKRSIFFFKVKDSKITQTFYQGNF